MKLDNFKTNESIERNLSKMYMIIMSQKTLVNKSVGISEKEKDASFSKADRIMLIINEIIKRKTKIGRVQSSIFSNISSSFIIK